MINKRYLKLQKYSRDLSTKLNQSYLKLVKFDPQTLLKLTHKRYSKLLKISQKFTHKHYSKFLKICRNRSTHVTQIAPQTLFKIT